MKFLTKFFLQFQNFGLQKRLIKTQLKIILIMKKKEREKLQTVETGILSITFWLTGPFCQLGHFAELHFYLLILLPEIR